VWALAKITISPLGGKAGPGCLSSELQYLPRVNERTRLLGSALPAGLVGNKPLPCRLELVCSPCGTLWPSGVGRQAKAGAPFCVIMLRTLHDLPASSFSNANSDENRPYANARASRAE
jgi:hypothetical protein